MVKIGINKVNHHKILTYKDFKIHYENEEAAIGIFNEIFNDNYYLIKSDTDTPLIIDCGANIGIATVFFKSLYPKARIICFEPDPNAYQLLKKNIEVNDFKDVTLINAAVAKEAGFANFYGQVDIEQPDSRGNSLIGAWGMQRTISKTIQVRTVKLSDYIIEPINLLKIDIEGAEQQVIEEIADKLQLVKNMVIEIHESKEIQHINCIDTIIAILQQHGFKYEYLYKNNMEILPEQVRDWAIQTQPHLYELKAFKSS